jgi:hypothetical protein
MIARSTSIGASATHPTPEKNQEAFEAVYPNMQLLRDLYKFLPTISQKFIKMLDFVLDNLVDNNFSVLGQCAAIVKSFAQCFSLILQYNEVKTSLPKSGFNSAALFPAGSR